MQAAILIDRADNTSSRRLESKQDTLKSQEELEAEAPPQTAALFSLIGYVAMRCMLGATRGCSVESTPRDRRPTVSGKYGTKPSTPKKKGETPQSFVKSHHNILENGGG